MRVGLFLSSILFIPILREAVAVQGLVRLASMAKRHQFWTLTDRPPKVNSQRALKVHLAYFRYQTSIEQSYLMGSMPARAARTTGQWPAVSSNRKIGTTR